MSEENKKVELKEEDLEKVSGGQYCFNVSKANGAQWKCPNCGNKDADSMRGNSYSCTRMECQLCWYEGPKEEFRYTLQDFLKDIGQSL